MQTLNIRGRIIDMSSPLVMGIINITEDSFYEGSKTLDIGAALMQAESMIKAGADILDVGAASSRPGAETVAPEVELKRACEVISAVRENFEDIIISIDTYRASVAKAALANGADMVNDISAGNLDDDMVSMVAHAGVPYVMMHMQGTPKHMQDAPSYEDVVTEVCAQLSERVALARAAGIKDIVVDPGFGFGKTVEHNYEILQHLKQLQLLSCPVLVGLSRKSMIQHVLDVKAVKALNGTTALHMVALERGAQILRVHDVAEAKQCVKLYLALQKHA